MSYLVCMIEQGPASHVSPNINTNDCKFPSINTLMIANRPKTIGGKRNVWMIDEVSTEFTQEGESCCPFIFYL